MTAVTAGTPLDATNAPAPRLTFPHLLRAEWIKLSTLRSTWWSVGIVAVLSVAVSAMMASAANDFGPGYMPIMAIVSPLQFTMLLAGILGAIAITGEYSTGMIRSTFTAAPRRGAVLVAKAIVTATLMFVVSLVVFLLSVAVTAPILREPVDWSDPAQSVLPILGGALSMVMFTLIGLSFGFLLRSGAGAISATIAVMFVLPIVAASFPYGDPAWQWVRDIAQYLPMNLAQSLTSVGDEYGLADGPALLGVAVWIVAGLVAAWGVLRRRDA
ncbi:ABC transporter permease [Microbacterium sp. No. 7]|uniref:ABC transporter permease n=1 Tax=Microbacterium sp. No. 7 TaxID=1714373 RepID=UPI0006D0638A|nr:ABC transporter permease [Microbacterium sp. No. 7]ALJ20262.1 integral membrane transport protein [Microbacterium sp. No. 7]